MDTGDKHQSVGAFFDLDMTITSHDTFRCFLKEHYVHDFRNWPFIPQMLFWALMRKLRLISLLTFKEKSLVFLKGRSDEEVRQLGYAFFHQYLLKIIRPKALERIRRHKEAGHSIYLATSCPNIFIQTIAEYFKFNGYICTNLEYSNRRFTGRSEGGDCFGQEKASRIKALAVTDRLTLADSYAYSDHESDLPMLETVGVPVAVTPTPTLQRIAAENGWGIENW